MKIKYTTNLALALTLSSFICSYAGVECQDGSTKARCGDSDSGNFHMRDSFLACGYEWRSKQYVSSMKNVEYSCTPQSGRCCSQLGVAVTITESTDSFPYFTYKTITVHDFTYVYQRK